MKFGGTSVANLERIRNVGAPCEARGRGRPPGRRRRLGHGGADRRARRLVPRGRPTHDGANMTRSSPPASRSPPASWPWCWRKWAFPPAPGRAGRSRSSRPTRARGRPHRRDPRRRARPPHGALQRGRGRLRLPGHAPADRPHHYARPRRLGHVARWRLPRPSMPSAATSIPTLTASTRPIRASCPGRAHERIAFEEMLEMASLGAKVLQMRSVELAMAYKVPTLVRSAFDDPEAPTADGTRRARHPRLR